tara:strand:- start:388 stop:1314 length:927 start_codon:yes stop_codon:yes gene_type:complete
MFRLIFTIIFLFFLSDSFAQTNLLNAETPDQIELSENEEENNELLKYEKIEPENVLWSKVVYEYIDLYQKLNYPLLYPNKDGNFRESRKSLWKTISDGIFDGSITELYKPGPGGDKFLGTLKIVDVDSTYYDDVKDYFTDNEYRDGKGRIASSSLGEKLSSEDILGYNIKGIWYFDKLHSELRYRLLGIQPFGNDIKDKISSQVQTRDIKKSEYPWIWYPSIREVLHKTKVFNDRNNNNRISFDDLLVNRRFSSYIYKYDNVYGDRKIKEYIVKRDNETDYQHQLRLLMESERIKKEILDFEIDMWGY